MNEPHSHAGQLAPYEPDHIVVVLPYLAPVQVALDELGVKVDKVDEDDRSEPLGLALLKLPHLQADVVSLRMDAELVRDAVNARKVSSLTGDNVPDLDLLMFALRRRFASRYHGWTPTMGKNRHVDGIHGLPEIVGGGSGFPEAIKPNSFRLAPRSSGPGRRVRVGVLDTRLSPHAYLQGRYFAEADTLLPEATLFPQAAGHATFIAGLILAQAPDAELDVRRVLSDDAATATTWEVATKMVEFLGAGVDVLNLSFGCEVEDGQGPLVLARAVELLSAEIVLVAAAGNHPPDKSRSSTPGAKTPTYPAAFSDVVAVGALAADGNPAPFNPDGPWMDLLAAGVDVESTYLTGGVTVKRNDVPGGTTTVRFSGFAKWSGTSFAAANVTGEIAANTEPGCRSAREVVREMANPTPGHVSFRARPYPLML
jgi:hypothetical protein